MNWNNGIERNEVTTEDLMWKKYEKETYKGTSMS